VKRYCLSHLSDEVLLRGLASAVARERTSIAEVLAHIGEVDDRRLHVPAGYPSMYLYCVQVLHLSEDAAFKRIQVARAARRFPAILEGLAEGRLHLTGVGMLVPHFTEDTAAQLLAAAAGKTKAGIEHLLAERFPKSDLLAWVAPMAAAVPSPSAAQLAPAQVGRVQETVLPTGTEARQPAPGQVNTRPRVAPLSAESYALQVTMGRGAHEKLRHVQELLAHQIPSGDLAQVLERVLDLAIAQLEKRKAPTTRLRPRPNRPSENPRHIPDHVRRAVWKRDGGQCTFVSDDGHRCEARRFIEIDHVEPAARGGDSSVTNLRLRCRAHNQYAAECAFGAEFMRHKRNAAAERRAAARGT
jgi:5-methylcytosine-specific restriction endonuclease McrA